MKYVTPAFFCLKRGEKNVVKERRGETTTVELVGYSVIRNFYSPKYKANETPEIKDDFRRTIYWGPLIRTYSDGKAEVSFYNIDEPDKINVVVEGINSERKLCRGITNYIVSF